MASTFHLPHRHPGHLELIIGCMFSGKTSELMRRVRCYTYAGHSCLVVKHSSDTRYSLQSATMIDCPGLSLNATTSITTHDLISYSAIAVAHLGSLTAQVLDSHSVIAIDEGQFYSDIEPLVDTWAAQGKIVIIAALDSTFQRQPFTAITNLVAKAEHVQKLFAVCVSCGGNASYSKRISDETAVQVVGGKDKYVAVCRHCFVKK